MTYYVSTFKTPGGLFSVACDAAGALVASAFGPAARLRRYLPADRLEPDAVRTRPARQQVREYFAGRRTRFTVPLAPAGTPFQQRVWQALACIRFGTTCSYGALARTLGSSPRAVGRANGANPLCLFIPCHRVVGADGALTGFAFGLRLKRRLLESEHGLRKRVAKAQLAPGTGAGG